MGLDLYTIEWIKKLERQVSSLESQNSELTNENVYLKEKIDELEKSLYNETMSDYDKYLDEIIADNPIEFLE